MIYTTNSEGLILEEVTVYASPTFAFNENSSATHYLRNVADRRPLRRISCGISCACARLTPMPSMPGG